MDRSLEVIAAEVLAIDTEITELKSDQFRQWGAIEASNQRSRDIGERIDRLKLRKQLLNIEYQLARRFYE